TPTWSTSPAGADATPPGRRGRTRPAGEGGPPSPPFAAQRSEAGDDLGHGLAHLGGVAADAHAGRFERLDLGLRGALRPRDDRARVAHLLARGRGHPGDVRHDRLRHLLADVLGGAFLVGPADLTDHDDGPRVGIGLERGEAVDEAGAGNRVAADADAGGDAD